MFFMRLSSKVKAPKTTYVYVGATESFLAGRGKMICVHLDQWMKSHDGATEERRSLHRNEDIELIDRSRKCLPLAERLLFVTG